MADEIDGSNELPSTAGRVAETYPDIWNEYTDLGKACLAAGPVDVETNRLVKLALVVGSRSERDVHLDVRRALSEESLFWGVAELLADSLVDFD